MLRAEEEGKVLIAGLPRSVLNGRLKCAVSIVGGEKCCLRERGKDDECCM